MKAFSNHPLHLLIALAFVSGCGSSTRNIFNDPACSYRGSDGIDACIRTTSVTPTPSQPGESAGQLFVNGTLVHAAQVFTGYYYDAQEAEWDLQGEWVIYNVVLHRDGSTITTVSGYNFVSGTKWSSPLDSSGNRKIASGRVYFNNLNTGVTSRWSLRLDGTDLKKES